MPVFSASDRSSGTVTGRKMMGDESATNKGIFDDDVISTSLSSDKLPVETA